MLIKILGDGSEAKAEIDEVDAKVDEFGKKRAVAEIHVDADQAREAIATVIAEAKLIPSEKTLTIRVAGEQAKLEKLNSEMAGLSTALEKASQEGGNTDRIIQQMGAKAAQIDAVKSRIEQLGKDFNSLGSKSSSALVRMSSGFRSVRTELDGLVEHIPLIGGLSNTLSNLVSSGLSKLVTMLPTAAQGFGGQLG